MSRRKRGRGPAYTPPAVRRSTDAEIDTTDKALLPSLSARSGRGNQATTVPLTEVIDALTRSLMHGGRPIVPLPTDPRNLGNFGPGNPLHISAIDEGRIDTGRPEPRIAEYQVNSNQQLVTDRPLDWKLLRKAADEVDLIRLCIEKRKDHLASFRWGWVVSEEAIDAEIDGLGVGKTQRGAAREDVEAKLRGRLQPDIARLNAWWRTPWKRQQLDIKQWWGLVLEEHLVLDAVAIYPEMTYGGEVLNFKVIDGSTIKPLRDIKGEIPEPPFPAYQQLLYGYPRGEYTATTVETEQGTVIPGAYMPDQLFYYRKVVKNRTPFGHSAVEQALISARLWLNRQGWLISEYDDGTAPRTWLVPPENASAAMGEQFTPQKRREWQRSFNDEMAGNTAARQRAQVTPPGWEPHEMTSIDAMYKPEYDMFLVRVLAAHMGVTMTDLNFMESGGLGSTGYHEGQADLQERIGTQPSVEMLQSIITTLARTYQKCPPELEFKIFSADTDDQDAQDEVIDRKYRRGELTLNETRDIAGKPRYPFREADMPALVSDRGMLYLEGSSALAPPGVLLTPPNMPEPPGGFGNDDSDPDAGNTGAEPGGAGSASGSASAPPAGRRAPNAKRKEVEAYRNWLRHGGKGRFELRELTAAEAVGYRIDLDRVRFKAAGDPDPKVQPPDQGADATDWPGWQYDLDAAAYWAPRIADALSGSVDADRLARDWLTHHPTVAPSPESTAAPAAGTPVPTPGPQPEERALPAGVTGEELPAVQAGEAHYEAVAEAFVQREQDSIVTALTDVMGGVYSDGYAIGAAAATAVVDQAPIDLGTWVVGDTEAAELLLSHLGDGSGLRTLLNQAGVTIRSIASTRLDELGRALARGAMNGDSADTIARDIRGLLSNPNRAHMIATTELNRAVSAASIACYGRRGYDGKYWLTADDDRVCPTICEPNEDEGVIPIGDPFQSGALHPPGHPLCRCAPMPGRLTTKESDLR